MKMVNFTLDTNCIIDIDENRPSASSLRRLVDAHVRMAANVALVMVSASERQRGDTYLNTYAEFQERVTRLDLEQLQQIPGLGYFGLSYWDHALWASGDCVAREQVIHATLFRHIPFEWSDYALAHGVDPGDKASPLYMKWRNAWCDRQMAWSHDHHVRDVFVSSDRNFARLDGAPGFAAFRTMTPQEAAALL